MSEVKERLREILLDVWKMEHSYEVLHHSEAGDYTSSEKVIKLIDHLIEDSTKHRRMVGDLFKMVGDEEPNLYGHKTLDFNFDRATNCEALEQIIWVEKKMLAEYEEALELMNGNDHFDFISDEALVDLRKHLELLKRWEGAHQRMAEETLRAECRQIPPLTE